MKRTIPITALFLSLVLLLGCSPEPAFSGSLAQPVYPEMAPYPDESRFLHPGTGTFDSEGFSAAYDAWRTDQRQQRDRPQDYASGLKEYFQKAVPAFLTGEENPVCSPLNVYMALTMLSEITGGTSRQEILSLLNADSVEALRSQAGHVWNAHYCNDGASASILANSLWLDNGLAYSADAVNRLAESYYASVFQTDLGSEEGNRLLRQWLNDQTHGLLEEQAQNLSLAPQTVLAMASTMYYRAKWSEEFRSENNTENTFHCPDGDRTVTFLKQELSYGPYYWGDDFGAVALGLEDGSRMWLILPDEGKGPADLLSDGAAMDLVLGGWRETGAQKSLRIHLRLPKFDVSSDIRLEDAFRKLGVTTVFNPDAADFSPILPEQAAWLDTVNHAARVKIDEEGVEAAAYTVMAVCGAAMPPEDEMDFVLDRPFLFFITSRDDLPLFAGIVHTP